MQRSADESVSVWAETIQGAPPVPPLQEDLKADICIVGAGIAGLSIAYTLQQEGRDVVLLDAIGVGAGETGRTTAHLTMPDDGFSRLIGLFGEEKARLALQSHRAAIDRIEAIVRQEEIDCDFERIDGYLTASGPDQEKQFDAEAKAIATIGLPAVEHLPGLPFVGIKAGQVMRFPDQATFNAGKYITGLAAIFRRRGGRIFSGAHVTEAHGGAAPHVLTENGFRVDAGAVIVATHSPVNDRLKMHTKQAAYRTYVIACEVPAESFSGFLLWDLAEPYHYVRLARGEPNMLLIGGMDHKTGQENDAGKRYKFLELWARARIPVLGEVRHRWSGQIMEPVDGLAFIGRNPGEDNLYIITGDSGNGMTHATIAGMLIPDLIHGRPNLWKDIYDPARKTVAAAGSFAKENLNAVSHMAGDWIAPSEVEREADIRPGHGAIMRDGMSKVAVYRDAKGMLHKCSAVCTHLGCVVQWNGGEKSWDCPCHGSRYDTEGRVLNGPAVAPLEALDTLDQGAAFGRPKTQPEAGKPP